MAKKMNNFFVSIIIPCRNEEEFIGKCLDSVTNQDFPKEKTEVLVVEGRSKDKTKKIIQNYSQRFSFIKCLDNPKKIAPCALNMGIKEAKGEIIIRMDAHMSYKKDYVQKCADYLIKYKADNVGGIIKTIPSKKGLRAEAIAVCLSHFFGAGGSYFRTGSDKPRFVDTVFGGCYKKEIFNRIGFFNENLKRSQDMEFNLRLKRKGGKILLMPDIISYYYPKSNFRDFFVHNIKDGIWAIYPLKFVKTPLRLRHYIPFLFVSGLLLTGLLGIFLPVFFFIFILTLLFYFLIAFYFSIKISAEKKDARFLFLMPIVFFIRHFGYGAGSIFGFLKLLFPVRKLKKKKINY